MAVRSATVVFDQLAKSLRRSRPDFNARPPPPPQKKISRLATESVQLFQTDEDRKSSAFVSTRVAARDRILYVYSERRADCREREIERERERGLFLDCGAEPRTATIR